MYSMSNYNSIIDKSCSLWSVVLTVGLCDKAEELSDLSLYIGDRRGKSRKTRTICHNHCRKLSETNPEVIHEQSILYQSVTVVWVNSQPFCPQINVWLVNNNGEFLPLLKYSIQCLFVMLAINIKLKKAAPKAGWHYILSGNEQSPNLTNIV